MRFSDSKGGRDRESYVLDEYRADVERVISDARKRGGDDERLFDHVHSAADVHSYRREYAQAVYEAAQADSGLRHAVIEQNNAVEGISHSAPDGGEYKLRDGSGDVYDRAALQTVSLCLGHNRKDTSIAHYLK